MTRFALTIPRTEGLPLDFEVGLGETVFVLGPNGTGKSELMHRFYCANENSARRIIAHRQTWFYGNAAAISAADKLNAEPNIRSQDRQLSARFMDVHAHQRVNFSLFELADAENVHARSVADAVSCGDINLAKSISKAEGPLKVINRLLRLSNIPIVISLGKGEQIFASKNGGPSYSIAALSDGERNALLVASDVLTAKTGTLILIDEPERHLHRSIISSLLINLFAAKPDCAFIVSTHETMLPIDHPDTRTLLLRNCSFTGESVSSWDADMIEPGTEIDDDLKKEILGARRRLLFIEGEEHSLDKPLYSLVFPNVSVIPKSGCREVETAVTGVRESANLHWVKAFGVIDNDGRSVTEVAELKTKGVYATSFFSVESIYYDSEVQRRIAVRQQNLTGDEADTLLAKAKTAALTAAASHGQRLSGRVVEKVLCEKLMKKAPGQNEIAAGEPISISIDVAGAVAEEREHFERLIEESNLSEIIRRYPIRETPALAEIAKKLGFQNHHQYERAVLKLLVDDDEALELVRRLLGELRTDIGEG